MKSFNPISTCMSHCHKGGLNIKSWLWRACWLMHFVFSYLEDRILVEQLAKVNPILLSSDEKLAFWINLYNALIMHVSFLNSVSCILFSWVIGLLWCQTLCFTLCTDLIAGLSGVWGPTKWDEVFFAVAKGLSTVIQFDSLAYLADKPVDLHGKCFFIWYTLVAIIIRRLLFSRLDHKQATELISC